MYFKFFQWFCYLFFKDNVIRERAFLKYYNAVKKGLYPTKYDAKSLSADTQIGIQTATTTIGGYGELHWDMENENMDFHRFIVFLSLNFDENKLFFLGDSLSPYVSGENNDQMYGELSGGGYTLYSQITNSIYTNFEALAENTLNSSS